MKNAKVNETVNGTVNPGARGALDAFLTQHSMTMSELRKMLRNEGVQAARQRNGAAAVAEKTGLPAAMLNGLNLGGLELVLYAICGGNDAALGEVTRPDISGETAADTNTKRAAAVRGSSQSWRSLVVNGWHITIEKNGKKYVLPVK